MPEPTGRLIIAGTHSGCGKTTVTVALLAALRARGLALASFKCGPDYIDPMFHRRALGLPSHNLDPYLCPPGQLSQSVADHGRNRLSVIEGVMGYYDGLGATTKASTFTVARATATPAVLVLDTHGLAASAGAILQGFAHFRRPSGLVGALLNRVSARRATVFDHLIRDAGLIPFGCLPQHDEATLPSRRLGLVTADEIDSLDDILATLARLAQDHIDLDGLLDLAGQAPPLPAPRDDSRGSAGGSGDRPVRIAVARDEAFCFTYAETLELWERWGCELAFFSPLTDTRLPDAATALYLPGGYPENHLAALSANADLRAALRASILGGLPTIAECGGFLYLHKAIDAHPMVGVIDASATSTSGLQHFGYATLTARRDNLLCRAHENLPAHEFHYYASTDPGRDVTARQASSGTTHPGGHASATLFAGFPHLYLAAAPAAARRFVDQARAYAHVHLPPPTGQTSGLAWASASVSPPASASPSASASVSASAQPPWAAGRDTTP
jgi:cobyrinic acid a,c-diamide synthase